MKWKYGLAAALLILACVVPFSSQRPDAIQHVLGLSGGVEGAFKAALGITVAAGAAVLIGAILKKTGRNDRP